MVVFGGFLVLIGTLFFLSWLTARRRLGQMASVPVSTVRELEQALNSARPARVNERAANLFTRPAAVEGIVRCDSPLTSELSGVPCVFYKVVVKRRYRNHFKIAERRSSGVSFWVEDRTGRVLVDPTGASVNGMRVLDDYEPTVGRAVKVGDTTLHVAGPVGVGQETAVRYREDVVPLDKPVYVLGDASIGPDSVVIRNPGGSRDGMIVSLPSGEELAQRTGAATWWLFLLGLFFSLGGAAMVAMELLT